MLGAPRQTGTPFHHHTGDNHPSAQLRHGPLRHLKTAQVKRLKELETENARLRKAVSDLTLDKMILAEAARGNF
jgi:hypothetical protein